MSGVTVNYSGNGMFSVTVNGRTETLNMADLNAMLRMEQVEGMDQTIADQLGEIRKTNEKRKTLNFLLSFARKRKADGDNLNGKSFPLDGRSSRDVRTLSAWMTEFGITSTDISGRRSNSSDKSNWDSAWDTNISAIKTAIDNVTSDSEMQMLRFRQMVDKRGTALQEAKTTLSNDKRLKDAIVQG